MAAPALALLEFATIVGGIEAGDAMVKQAPLDYCYAGTVQPGKYLVLVAGDTASVEEAIAAAVSIRGGEIIDRVFLPDVHPDVVDALVGEPSEEWNDALGIVEARTVASIVDVADAGVKGAAVTLPAVRLADGLGGRGYVLFAGPVSEVEAAVEIGAVRIEPTGHLVDRVVIAQLHPEMLANLSDHPRFWRRITTHEVR
jgi:microcompartment protein CcmL/EutN